MYPTNPLTILEPRDQQIGEFYVVQEGWATDFEAQNCERVRRAVTGIGMLTPGRVIFHSLVIVALRARETDSDGARLSNLSFLWINSIFHFSSATSWEVEEDFFLCPAP